MPALLGVWRIEEAGTPLRRLPDGQVVRDAEHLCQAIVRETAGKMTLGWDDERELLSHLFEQLVVLVPKYDASRRGIRFNLWVYRELRLDAVDFARSFFGRRGEKRVFDERFLTRDRGGDPLEIYPKDAIEDTGDSGKRRLGEADEAITTDDLADRVSALGGLLDDGGGAADRALRGLRRYQRETASRGTRGADHILTRRAA